MVHLPETQDELQELIAKVRADALQEAADAVLHNAGDPAYTGVRDNYGRGYRQGMRDAVRALRRKARRGDERCATCGCELAYPSAAHVLDCEYDQAVTGGDEK